MPCPFGAKIELPQRGQTFKPRATPWELLAKNWIHLVYSTKNRNLWLEKDTRDDLFAYQAGIFQHWESPSLIIGGVEDHVHALFLLSKNHALKKIVEEVKKGSSKWMKSNGPRIVSFEWQAGYAAFSVSESKIEVVRTYIATQEAHHRDMRFEDELRSMFLKHRLTFDEGYVWD